MTSTVLWVKSLQPFGKAEFTQRKCQNESKEGCEKLLPDVTNFPV